MINDDEWFFFPFAGGVPVPPVVAPAPPPLGAALPDGGPLFFSDGAQNVVTRENIDEGDQLVNWNMNRDLEGKRESDFGHYYKMNTYNQLPNPKVSPLTRALINTKNYSYLLLNFSRNPPAAIIPSSLCGSIISIFFFIYFI